MAVTLCLQVRFEGAAWEWRIVDDAGAVVENGPSNVYRFRELATAEGRRVLRELRAADWEDVPDEC